MSTACIHRCLASAALLVLLSAGLAHAQSGAPVLLLIEQQVAPAVQSQVSSILSERLRIVPMEVYLGRAQQAGLDPGSPQTIAQLLPGLGVRLGIVVEYAAASVIRVRYYDGRTGAEQGVEMLQVTAWGIQPDQAHLLRRMTAARLRGSPASGSAPDDADDADDADYADSSRDDEADDASGDRPAVRGRVAGGIGFGARQLQWPAQGGTETVDAGSFLAYSMTGEFEVRMTGRLWLGALVNYDSSLANTVSEQHVGGPPRDMGLRVHHVDPAVSAALDLSQSGAWGIRLALGYGVRGMRPEVHHLRTPSVTLSGPYLRPELQLPLPIAGVSMRLGGEVQSIVQVGADLQALGAAADGVGVGGEARIDYAITKAWFAGVRFRQAQLWIGAAEGEDITDMERFVTFQLGGAL